MQSINQSINKFLGWPKNYHKDHARRDS